MKKQTTPPPDLNQAFSKVKVLEPVHVADDPNVEADAEVRAYLLFREIADLYCTKPGERPSCPQTFYVSDNSWGHYHFQILPYDRVDSGFDPIDEDDLIDFDPDIYDGLRIMVADLSMHGTIKSEVFEHDKVHTFFCEKIEDLLCTLHNVLISDECPGSVYTRQRLYKKLQDVIRAVTIEQEREKLPERGLH